MTTTVQRLALAPGQWAALPLEARQSLQRADLVIWQKGADPSVLASLHGHQSWCELTPDLALPPELAHTGPLSPRQVLLVQAPGATPPPWLDEDPRLVQEPLQGPSQPAPVPAPQVLLTRRASLNQSMGELLWQAGISSLSLPTLAHGDPADPALVQRTLSQLDRYFGVMVTSPRGAQALGQSLGEAPKIPDSIKIAAVGRSTAQALQDLNLPCHLYPSEAHSEGLARALQDKGWLGRTWLHLRGDKGRPVLQDAVHAAGGQYHRVECYQSLRPELPDPLVRAAMAPSLKVVSFASGQSYQHFKTTLGAITSASALAARLASLAVISFGPITSAALQRDKIKIAVELPHPDRDAQLHAIREQLSA